MAQDEDLASLLPEAPPRPERREAAIAAAMRVFDGEAPPKSAASRRPAFAWPKLGRPQLGALVSMALLGVIGIPLALNIVREEQQETGRQPDAARPKATTSASAPQTTAPNAQKAPTGEPAEQEREPVSTPTPAADAFAEDTPRQAPAPPPPMQSLPSNAPILAPPPPPPPPPLPAPSAPPAPAAKAGAADRGREEIVVTGARRAQQSYDSPTSVTVAGAEENGDIVVSASRVSRASQRAAQRGDWNACTIDDPARRIDRCKTQINPAQKGARGQAAARVAEGLALAWNGDTRRALTAFEEAAAIDPKRAIIQLNRGLAYQRLGDADRAIAALSEAIRIAPADPRAYYHRSRAYGANGDERRANADQARAISLDRDYAELFD